MQAHPHIFVRQLAYAKAKGQDMTFVQDAVFAEGIGMLCDYHAHDKQPSRHSDGLVVIVDEILVDFLAHSKVKGLCFKRFKYNICLSESIQYLKDNTCIKIGCSLLTIATKKKKCFAMENSKQPCQLMHKNCLLPHHVVFAKVVKGSQIFVGDNVSIKDVCP